MSDETDPSCALQKTRTSTDFMETWGVLASGIFVFNIFMVYYLALDIYREIFFSFTENGRVMVGPIPYEGFVLVFLPVFALLVRPCWLLAQLLTSKVRYSWTLIYGLFFLHLLFMYFAPITYTKSWTPNGEVKVTTLFTEKTSPKLPPVNPHFEGEDISR